MKQAKEKRQKSSFGKGSWKAFFRLMPQIRLPWLLIAVGFLINISESEIRARVPVSTSELFSGSFTGSALASAVLYQVISFLLLSVSIFASSFITYFSTMRARKVLWERMLRTSMEHYDANDPSDVLSTIANDTETAVTAIVSQLISIIPTLYLVFRVLSTLGNYDMRLMASVFVLIPVNVVFVIVVGHWRYETNAGIYRRIGGLTGYLAERVANIPLIRTYTNEKAEAVNGMEAFQGLYDANIRAARVTFAANGVSSVLEVVQRGVSILFGVFLLGQGEIDMQQWIAFFLYVGMVIPRVNDLISIWESIKAAQGAAARMIAILEAPKEAQTAGERSGKPEGGDIEFRHVSFSYGDKPALRDVSLCIPQGKSTAIVGCCGSGKTTLLSLIERLYVPAEGSITMGGVPVGEFALADYRDCFAYVQQGSGLFSGTLRSAMTYGIQRPLGDDEILKAAGAAGAAKLVDVIEGGLDGHLAISGRSLSGGQRQRVVLTRELLKNRDVLLLDEPTSALDAQTAREVQQTIFQLFDGKTLVFITHDLNMLGSVDQIIVMDHGRVAGCGCHGDLMESCGAYQALVRSGEIKEAAE